MGRTGPQAEIFAALLAGALTTSVAQAGGFALREQSAWGQGSSFAGVAAGGSLSSMFWNPATLSDVEGLEIEGVMAGIAPFSDVEYSAPPLALPLTDAGDIALDALVPAAYGAKRINERLVLGVGLNSAYGLATTYDSPPIQNAGVAGTSKIFSMNLNPAASYQMTDWLAVALGAQLQYISLRYTLQAIPGIGITSLEGNDFGLGLTAGVQITPMPGTEIGIGYRSRIDHKLDGTLTNETLGGVEIDATAESFDLPDVVTLGIHQSITDRLRVMAGAEWSNWSRFDTVELNIPGVVIPLTFDYEDGWFFSAGGEFDVNERLTLRAGAGYELSPIEDDTRTFRLPDSDRLWLSAGAGYAPNARWSFDAGYSFVLAEDADILSAAGGGPPANGPFTGDADSLVHIVSLGARLKLGGQPALPAP